MKAYSTDLRQKIIETWQRGQTTQRTIAELFGVSVSFVEKLLQRYRTTGTFTAKPHGGGQKRRLDADADQHILAWIQAQPDPGSSTGQALRAHKIAGIGEAIAACGAEVVYLPPYSPDLSPIESCWSKLKAALRGAKARTHEALNAALAEAWESVTASDAQGWFTHCGYTI